MSDGRYLSLERALVDLIVIAMAASIGAFALDKTSTLFSRKDRAAAPSAAIVGVRVNLKRRHPEQHPLSVVIVASPGCVFCQRSAPFYKTLWNKARKSGTPVYVALPSENGATEYLKSAGLEGAIVTTWDDLGVKVDGTPTILIADRTATVRRSWLGMLGTDKAGEVLDLISSPDKLTEKTQAGADPDQLTTEDELKARAQHREPFTVVDIRERGDFAREHRLGAINIPLDELYIRGPFELRQSDLQVIDCVGVTPKACRSAANWLRQSAFAVELLASARSGSSRFTPQ